MRRVPPLTSPTVELTRATLKDYGHVGADGSVTPFIGHRLVWIIWYKSVTIDPADFSHPGPTGARGPTPTTSTSLPVEPGTMSFITFVDAHAGTCLNTEGFHR
jgi:hypothetical protein